MLSFLQKIFSSNKNQSQQNSNEKKPQTNYYKLLGEKQGLREIVDKFYEIMENDPKANAALIIHNLEDGKIAEESKIKLHYFLCGWLGGPNLFVEVYGAPMMRKRHLHVKITAKEKDQWLYCMNKALDIKYISKDEKKILMNSFTALGMRIQNA